MSNAKTIIKINEKLYEISVDDKRRDIAHRELTDDEAAEFYLLTRPDNADFKLQEELNEMVTHVTNELKTTFKDSLKRNVLRILGFSDSYSSRGGWEVDRSSNSTQSIINQLVSAELKTFVTDNIKGPAFNLTKVEINSMIKAAKVEYLRNCEYTIKSEIRNQMQTQIRDLVAKTVGELVSGQEVEIKKTIADVLKGGYKRI